MADKTVDLGRQLQVATLDVFIVYVGNGKVVEALNESLGVVYRDVASTGKIVVIGRP